MVLAGCTEEWVSHVDLSGEWQAKTQAAPDMPKNVTIVDEGFGEVVLKGFIERDVYGTWEGCPNRTSQAPVTFDWAEMTVTVDCAEETMLGTYLDGDGKLVQVFFERI